MNTGFSTGIEITNSDNLFGRKEIFNQLLFLANSKYSVSITGLRRFGKTSVLKSIETSLREDSKSKVYPIFFDFKEVGSIIKGTDNVYRYMISRLVTTLFDDNHFRGESLFRNIIIQPSNLWEDIFECLKEVNAVRIQGLFEDIVMFFSECLDKTILFLFDEYEWLFRFSFDNPVGFMKLRNFSSKVSTNGIKPFCFWIAGSISWDYLCTITGSGELNVIDAPPISLGTIESGDFEKMWQNEVGNLSDCSELIKNSGKFAFIASGGVPFYGKIIGSYIVANNTKPTFTCLKSYFQELINSLQNEEKTILFDLSKNSKSYKNSKFILELLEKGLIVKNNSVYEIKIGFLKEFLNSLQLSLNNSLNKGTFESEEITDKITSLITNINNTNKNKKGSYIFEPVVDEAALIKDLRTPCYSLALFSDFSSSLYKIIFERTKDNRNGVDKTLARLPNTFKRNNQFIDVVDIMRHSLGGGHLMDTFVQRNGQLSKSRMLEILVGTKNEPSSSEDFYNLQIASLKMFENELMKLNAIVRSYT